MDTNLLLTTLVTILLAFVGYWVTYFNNLRLSQRTEKLERINRQLAELYGPMFAHASASDIAWRAFRSVYRANQVNFFREGPPPTEAELIAWRLWISTVFMPINLRIYELILAKSDLLIESKMPEGLLLFCAHVAAYQAVMKKWENGDFSENTSLVSYPSKMILDYSRSSFQNLKAEQEKILGKKIKK